MVLPKQKTLLKKKEHTTPHTKKKIVIIGAEEILLYKILKNLFRFLSNIMLMP